MMPLRARTFGISAVLLAIGGVLWIAGAQNAPQPSRTDRFQKMSAEAEARGLAEPFKGITTNGTPMPGLFPIRSTGVSTEPVRVAAEAWLAFALRGAAHEDDLRRGRPRVAEVDEPALLRPTGRRLRRDDRGPTRCRLRPAGRLVERQGLTLTRDIMKLNHTLGELNNNDFEQYGEWLYHITVMGTPSATEPWGWQLDGHHVIINYFVLGDQVVMTPTFVGSEPVIAEAGKYKGTAILQGEQRQGLAFLRGLTDAQRAKAIVSVGKDRQQQHRRGVQGQRRARLRRRARDRSLARSAGHRCSALVGHLRRQHGRRPRAREDGRGRRRTSTTRTSPGSAAPTTRRCSTTASTAPSS